MPESKIVQKVIHMLKEATYSEKIAMLKGWLETIVHDIKRDIKSDHLKKDGNFAKNYFPQKNINKLTVSELAEGYSIAIDDKERADALGEFIANRWLLKNTDVYDYFAKQLHQVTENFDSLDVIDLELAKKIMAESIKSFGAQKTYLFSVLNSVVFPKEIFDELREKAEAERLQSVKDEEIEKVQKDWDSQQKHFEQLIARLTDKYEKKLAGIEKKYLKDTEALKKQIAALQKRLEQKKEAM